MALPELVETHARRRQSLTERLIRMLLGLWLTFDDWSDQDLVTVRAARSAELVDSALREMRLNSRVYSLEMLRELNASADDLRPIVHVYPRSLVDTLEVYERPAKQYRRELRGGKTPEEALTILEDRIAAVAEMDVAAVNRDESNLVLAAAPKIIGYRRVLHPELSRTGACGLCVVAASRFYTVKELEALHDRCKCETVGVTSDADPGLILNREDLDSIYKAAGGNEAEVLKRTRVEIREHGELGPILTRAEHEHRGPADVGRAPYTAPAYTENQAKLRARHDRLTETITELEHRIDAKAGDPKKLSTAVTEARRAAETIAAQLAA